MFTKLLCLSALTLALSWFSVRSSPFSRAISRPFKPGNHPGKGDKLNNKKKVVKCLYLHQIWFECLQSSFVCLPWHWLLAGLACVLHPFPGLFPGRWNWKQISFAVKGQFFVGDQWWSLWLWSPFWNWTFLNPRCLQLQRVRTLYVAPSVPKLKRKIHEWMNEFWILNFKNWYKGGFFQKVMMDLSFPQTDKILLFFRAWILILLYFKRLKSCQIRAWRLI